MKNPAYLYKYMPIKYVLPMLKNRKILFSRICKWEDVYENFIFKQKYFLNDGTAISAKEMGEQELFAQSWTYTGKESDAMWRIYSHPEQGICESAVRLKVSLKKISELFSSDIMMKDGKVLYKSQEDIESWVKKHSQIFVRQLNDMFTEAAFIKRKAFEHEKEYRFVSASSTNKHIKNFLEFEFQEMKLTDIFKGFLFDPRLEDNEYKCLRELLVSYGIPENNIQKSNLYSFVSHKIKIVD